MAEPKDRSPSVTRTADAVPPARVDRPAAVTPPAAGARPAAGAPLDPALHSLLVGLSSAYPLVLAFERVGDSGPATRRDPADGFPALWCHDEWGLLGGAASDLDPSASPIEASAISDADPTIAPAEAAAGLDPLFAHCRAEGCVANESIRVGLGNRDIELTTFDLPGTPSSAEASPLRVALARDAANGAATPLELERLRDKNAELEICVRSLSHDLRSPLVSVLGFTRLLRDEFGEPLGRTGHHFIDRIEQAGRHMERLIDDLLELARIDDAPRFPVLVDPAPVLAQLAAELKIRLDEADIDLVLPVDPPALVCDRTRLYQVLSNLVGNAIQHTQTASAERADRGRIEVEIEEAGGGWQLSVRDNGPGIAPEDHGRIFQAFQTAGRRGGRKKSSGLGLAIVKKIVETHRGRVWLESEPGAGARFVVWLPQD